MNRSKSIEYLPESQQLEAYKQLCESMEADIDVLASVAKKIITVGKIDFKSDFNSFTLMNVLGNLIKHKNEILPEGEKIVRLVEKYGYGFN